MVQKVRSEHPQNKKVLRHLQQIGSLSPAEALRVYGIGRLAARVLDLRAAGHDIVRELRTDAEGHRYARYSIGKGTPPVPAPARAFYAQAD